MNEFTHLDLFSGIGGFSIAFEAAGFRTVAFSEVDPYACAVLKKNWPNVPNLGDVRKLCRRASDCKTTPGDWLLCPRCDEDFAECECVGTDQFTDTYGFPSVITAGIPCQPTSLMGKRKQQQDERWLWGEIARIVCELRPEFLVVENVPALLSSPGFDEILKDLAEAGYSAEWEVLRASCYGIRQNRDRLFLLAYPDRRVQEEPYKRAFLHREGPSTPFRRDQPIPHRMRVVNGVSDRVHIARRISACANAIVPAVVEPFAKLIHKSLTQLNLNK